MSNTDFGITAGLYAERPVSSDPTIKIGFRWFSTDTRVLSTLLVDSAGTRYWAEGPNAPVDIDLYVSAAGSNLNAGTIGSPIATVQEALHRAGATGWTRRCRIHIVGTINLGADPTLSVPVSSMGGEPVCFMGGAWTDSGLGTITAGGGTQGSNATTPGTRGTVTGLSLGATNYTGYKLRWITGTNASFGDPFWVAKNSAGTITAYNPFWSAPLAGDTFALEVPSSVLTWTGVMSMSPNGGAVTFYDGVELRCTGGTVQGFGLYFGGGRVNFVSCRIRSTSSTLGITPLAPSFVAFGLPGTITTYHPDLPDIFLGTYLQKANLLANNSTFDYLYCLLDGARSQLVDNVGFFFYRFCTATGDASCVVRNGSVAEFFNAYFDTVTARTAGTLTGAIACGAGGTLQIIKATDVSSSTNHGVVIEGPGAAVVAGLTGTANTGFGLHASRRAGVLVTDPNTGTTITGTSGNASVGANGATTWANIATGTAANCTDLAHANSQIVRVGA